MFFFFLNRPSCCHESLGGRYQIIAFDVRIMQHVIENSCGTWVSCGTQVPSFQQAFFCSLCTERGGGRLYTGYVFCRASAFSTPF